MHHLTDNLSHVIVVAAIFFAALAIENSKGQVSDSTLVTSLDTTTSPKRMLPGPREIWRGGAFVMVGRTLHTAEGITGLPGVPNCCDGFYNGYGSVWSLGLVGEIPISGHSIRVGWRFAASSYEGLLTRTIQEEINADRRLQIGLFEHSVTSSHFGFSLEPYLAFRPLRNGALRLGFNTEFMVSTAFSQEEQLVSPEGVTYSNGRRTRLEFSGPVEEANALFLGVTGALQYEFSISEDGEWVLVPEMTGFYGLSNMIDATPWLVHGARFGLSLQRVSLIHPELADESLEVVFPIRSGPTESLGTEDEGKAEEGPEEGKE